MQLFEFLMVLISIIIGLGVTEVLSGAAGLIRAREAVQWYWIQVVLQIAIFLALHQAWWESWERRLLPEITYGQSLTLLLGPVILFLIAHLLYPDPARGADLRSYYYRQAPVIWGLAALGTLIGTFVVPLSFRLDVLHPSNLSGLATAPMMVVLAVSKRPWIHGLLAPVVLLALVLDTVLAARVLAG
jgi:hypothetical protein